ncbi:MAG TPA: RNA polymerase sigma factor [Thermomicrobiales bacterium]
MAIPFRTRTTPDRPVSGRPPVETAIVSTNPVDRQGFARLYSCYGELIYRYCRRQLGSHEAAEDAAGLVFAKALAGLPTYRGGEEGFRSWIFTIAYRVIADHYRNDRAEQPLEMAADLIDETPSVEEVVLAAEERRSLRALLARLPADQRRVVELRLAGLSGAEIAVTLGRSHAAVKQLQFRAVTNLRALREAEAERCEVHHVPR